MGRSNRTGELGSGRIGTGKTGTGKEGRSRCRNKNRSDSRDSGTSRPSESRIGFGVD